ncbi:MAG: MFS transporter [Spirochaetales bacterium]|nr:MFS transporter [Spirochaetales bacterium]
MEIENKKLIRRNILFQSLDSGIFMMAMVFFHQMTIMVAFVKQLYDSPLIISLIPALLLIGFNLPGLVTTRLAERHVLRKKFITVFGFIQRLSILFMALSTFLLEPFGPNVTVAFVLFFYFSFSFFGGIGTPAWLDFSAKTIPVRYRARTNSLRAVIAGAGGIVLPLLINYFLTAFEFPQNYRLNFLSGFLVLSVSFVFFLFIKEAEASPAVRRKTFKQYLSSLVKILKRDKNFVRFLGTQAVLSVSECGAAFFTFYAIDLLKIGESTVVFYTFLLNLSFPIFGIILGFIGDKAGNLRVLQIGAFTTLAALVLIIFWPTHFIFYVIFILVGITVNARLNSFQVFITEFGDEKDRIRYSALSTTISATLFGLTPLAGGILLSSKLIDFNTLFIIGAVFAGLALFCFLFVVKDPRFSK